jgi:hypothetical protein
MTLVPPLIIGMIVVGWLSYRGAGERRSRGAEEQGRKQATFHVLRSTLHAHVSGFSAPPFLEESLAAVGLDV